MLSLIPVDVTMVPFEERTLLQSIVAPDIEMDVTLP